MNQKNVCVAGAPASPAALVTPTVAALVTITDQLSNFNINNIVYAKIFQD